LRLYSTVTKAGAMAALETLANDAHTPKLPTNPTMANIASAIVPLGRSGTRGAGKE
jgi:hypothetical protein